MSVEIVITEQQERIGIQCVRIASSSYIAQFMYMSKNTLFTSVPFKGSSEQNTIIKTIQEFRKYLKNNPSANKKLADMIADKYMEQNQLKMTF